MRDGVPIQEVPAGSGIGTGISYGIRIPGMVPDYEEMSAMAATNYNATQWRALSWQDRARAVAWYRLRRYEELHVSDAQARAAKRRAKAR